MKKKLVVLFILILLITIPIFVFNDDVPHFEGKVLDRQIPLESFKGKWYINMSSFPMWLKGNKNNPSFNYTIGMNDSLPGLNGDVQYYKKGALKHIKGFSKPQNKNNTVFIWRGTGLLRAVKSEWQIIGRDDEGEWAIMHFEQTTFSPEGYDVFSRQKNLTGQNKKEIEQKLEELGIEDQLKTVGQE